MAFYKCNGGGKTEYITKGYSIPKTYKPYTTTIDVSLSGYTPICAGINYFYQDGTYYGKVMSATCSLSGNVVTVSTSGSWDNAAPYYVVSIVVGYLKN